MDGAAVGVTAGGVGDVDRVGAAVVGTGEAGGLGATETETVGAAVLGTGEAGGLGTADGVAEIVVGTDVGLEKTDWAGLGAGVERLETGDALGLAEPAGPVGLAVGVGRPAAIAFAGQVGETALAK